MTMAVVRMTQNKAQDNIDDEADDTQSEHDRAINRLRIEKALDGKSDQEKSESPDEKNGHEGS